MKIELFRTRSAVPSLSGLLAKLGSPAAWGELVRVNLVDRIRVAPETRQAILVIIDDLVLDRDDAAQMLERKIGFYLQ